MATLGTAREVALAIEPGERHTAVALYTESCVPGACSRVRDTVDDIGIS